MMNLFVNLCFKSMKTFLKPKCRSFFILLFCSLEEKQIGKGGGGGGGMGELILAMALFRTKTENTVDWKKDQVAGVKCLPWLLIMPCCSQKY